MTLLAPEPRTRTAVLPTPRRPLRLVPARRRVDVLHVVEAFGGGVETAIASYVDNSAEMRHLVVARKRPAHDVSLPLAAEVVVVDGDLQHFLRRAHAEIRTHRPRIVHLHSSFAGLLRAVPCGGAEVVYSPHCFAFERNDLSPNRKRVLLAAEAVLGLRHQTIAAVSPYEVDRARHVAPRAHPHYLPNVGSGRPASAPRSAARVVTVGRISPQKDPRFFTRCVEAVRTAGIEWVWVGDGDAEQRAQLEAAGVTVTGWVTNEEAVRIVSTAALYLHTASWEGAPVSLLEAAHQHTPVLVRGIPSLAELGYATGGRTPAGLAAAVDHFFYSPAWADEVSSRTEAVVRSLCPERQRASLRELYAHREAS